jgi:branched-chain amino acid transport system substrate-binding protein
LSRLNLTALVPVLAALALITAPAAAQDAAQDTAPLRVLSLGGLTGAASGASADLMSARALVAVEVNAGGGLADGRRLSLEVVDVGCAGADAQGAEAVASAAMGASGAVAMLGPVCSDAALSVARAAIALGAPMISDGASSPALSALEDGDLVFRTAPSDVAMGAALADLALTRGHARMVVAHAGDAWAEGITGAFVAAYQAAGGVVVAQALLEEAPGAQDAGLAALDAAGPADALALFAYADERGIEALRAVLRRGAWQAVLGADGLLDVAVIDQIGALRLARVTLAAPAPDRAGEAWIRFAAKAAEVGIDADAPLAAQGYDAAMVMALALVRSGGQGGARLAQAIREVTAPGAPPVLPGNWAAARAAAAGGEVRYVGASGPIRFDAAGDVPGLIASWSARGAAWAPSRLR